MQLKNIWSVKLQSKDVTSFQEIKTIFLILQILKKTVIRNTCMHTKGIRILVILLPAILWRHPSTHILTECYNLKPIPSFKQ